MLAAGTDFRGSRRLGVQGVGIRVLGRIYIGSCKGPICGFFSEILEDFSNF